MRLVSLFALFSLCLLSTSLIGVVEANEEEIETIPFVAKDYLQGYTIDTNRCSIFIVDCRSGHVFTQTQPTLSLSLSFRFSSQVSGRSTVI